ncbi:MAG: shikimate kinase [Planctomycetes bacterium HGW-Planctomycetes-1]|nr:MAG: shikimate kinase [Planctomycetes bacterium HGW-Planctomycetes-1]
MSESKNIVLIGMPAVGKSTIGVLLAKRLGRYFLDTDVFIQAVSGRGLQEIIDSDGLDKFCKFEAEHILCIDKTDCVIATGGSAVYSDKAMNHLKENGTIIYLSLPLAIIKKRLTDLNIRGVVMSKGQTIDDLYKKRAPFYEKWAQIKIDCQNLTHEQAVDEIIKRLKDL